MGVLSALLVWEMDHVGSIPLAALVAAAAISTAALVTRRVGRQLTTIAAHYETLLDEADAASRRLEEANRTKDEFLATLSHELRTPLNSIVGWARLLQSGRLDAAQTKKAIAAIDRAGWAQSRLIDDLLDLSCIVSGKLQISTRPTALQPVVDAAVRALHPAAHAKGIDVSLHLSPTVPPVAADPDRVQQIVWNLVSNAIKFTPNGGRVHVSLSRETEAVVISVRDSGIGFGSDVAGRLFERLHQGDSSSTRAHGGLGVGLGIVRHLVELHGGTVTGVSEGANRGATFEVRLPLQPAAATSEDPEAPAATPVLTGVCVLVVDDNPRDLEVLRASLEQYGAHVVTATNASEARVRYASDMPDVLVSDIRLPDANGWELLQQIRQYDGRQGRRTCAAAVSALARAEDRHRTISAGFRVHVPKPVDPIEFASAVERLAQERRA